MKRYVKLLGLMYLGALLLTAPVQARAGFTNTNAGLTWVSDSSAVWGDYDADGDLDILIAGHTGHSIITQVWRNDGGGVFTDVNAGLTGISNASAAWGDYDADGDLDLLIAGSAGGGIITEIWRNDGGDAFTIINAGLTGVSEGSVAWGDYDADGDLDILLTGLTDSGRSTEIWWNSGGTFANSGEVLTAFQSGSAAWGDYDADGDLDVLLAGFTGSENKTEIWRNDGGTFVNSGAVLPWRFFSSAAWGDYDNDGDLDILLTGLTGGAGSPAATEIWRNDGGDVFTNINAGLAGISTGTAAWGDYDADGDLDVLIAGRNASWIPISQVWRNDGGDHFTNIGAGLTGVYDGSATWGDFDADGDLDILITGNTGSGYISEVWRNDGGLPNTPPTAPEGLSRVYTSDGIGFSWDPATDDQTPPEGLTYNIRIGTAPGKGDVAAPMADAGSGIRRLPAMGNAYHCLFYTFKGALPLNRAYYWSVQAVDSGFAGSSWGEDGWFGRGETLIINKTGSGSGTVSSAPPGIDCGAECFNNFPADGAVTLTATPGPLSVFKGWSGGGCGGTGDCTVTMDETKSVTAEFEYVPNWYALKIEKNGTGPGTITSLPPGIDCGDDCLHDFPRDASVTLTAAPDSTSVFTGWSGGGCGGTGDCTVTMDAAKTIAAGFDLAPDIFGLIVIKTGEGSGTISSAPTEIDCGADCHEYYARDRVVTMTGTPDAGSALDGWSEAGCPGNGPCTLTMNRDHLVAAEFNPDGDADGVSDKIEDAGPNNGDGNNDGTPDSQQKNVTSFPNVDGVYLTLASPDGTELAGVYSTSPPASADLPADIDVPLGAVRFQIKGVAVGGKVEAKLIIHDSYAPINAYYKYGPTQEDASDHWYDFTHFGDAGADVATEDDKTIIRLSFIDGGRGDSDMKADGVVTDPGAPAVTPVTPEPPEPSTGGGCFISSID